MAQNVTAEITISPRFRALIPPMLTEERRLLEESLVAEGCRNPLLVWKRPIPRKSDCFEYVLLDGHNRYEICRKRGITYKVHLLDKHFDDEDDAALWIIENQQGRRNLTDIDRIALAQKRAEIVAKQAKENMKAGGEKAGRGRPAEQGSAKLPNPIKPIDTRKEAARSAGVGERTYDAGKLILDAAEKGEIPAETIDEIRSGNKAIHKVAKEIKETREQESRKEEMNKAAEAAKEVDVSELADLRVCSMQDMLADLTGLDAIITDPPYTADAMPLYSQLAKLAAKALKPDGILAVMCGQSYLPEIMGAMSKHIMYRWTIAYLTPGGQAAQMWDRKVNTFWKPVLLFGGKGNWMGDVIKSDINDNDKRYHQWGQSESGITRLVETLTAPGALVCDPFLGAGTTAVVCLKLHRKFIGCDTNKTHVDTANKRLKIAAKDGA